MKLIMENWRHHLSEDRVPEPIPPGDGKEVPGIEDEDDEDASKIAQLVAQGKYTDLSDRDYKIKVEDIPRLLKAIYKALMSGDSSDLDR